MSFVNSIRAFREQARLSQEQLGEAISVTRQTIAAWESGDRPPTLLQLTKIAKQLSVSPTLLLEPPLEASTPSSEISLLFRADQPAALTPALRKLLTEKANNYAEIEQIVGELPALPEQRPLKIYSEYIVEEVAKEIRHWLGLGELTPLGDVLSLLEAKGLKILLHSLPSEISGFSAYTDDLGAVIFVNSDHPTERQFFTALHELAHLIFHRQEYKSPSDPIPHTARKDHREKSADHLAGAILLTEDILRKELHPYCDRWLPEPLLVDLKLRYNVSFKTIVIRAGQLGWISKKQTGQQLGVINKKYPDQEQPILDRAVCLNRLQRLTYLALLQEEITTTRAAEVLGVTLAKVRQELRCWTEEDKN